MWAWPLATSVGWPPQLLRSLGRVGRRDGWGSRDFSESLWVTWLQDRWFCWPFPLSLSPSPSVQQCKLCTACGWRRTFPQWMEFIVQHWFVFPMRTGDCWNIPWTSLVAEAPTCPGGLTPSGVNFLCPWRKKEHFGKSENNYSISIKFIFWI